MGAIVSRSSAQKKDVSSSGHNSLYSKNDIMATGSNESNTRLRSEPITKDNFNRILKETHECFVAPEGFQPEGELCDYRFCPKNPGHVGFIPMDQFSLHHVPSGHRPELEFEWIKALAAITVRIRSTYVSHGRPDNYPLDQLRGKQARSFGTGRFYESGRRITPCPCMDCGRKPGTASYFIDVQTAQHVIYDATEAKYATVDVYFDKAGPPDVTLTGYGEKEGFATMKSREFDLCFFSCITHDLETGKRLDKDVKRFEELRDEIKKEVSKGFDPQYLPIVSHPHGFHKQVSFGDVKDLDHFDGDPKFACYYYTTPTCSGSSGAYIRPWRQLWDFSPHVHHAYDSIRKENRSGFGFFQPRYGIEDVESELPNAWTRTDLNQQIHSQDLSSFSWYHGNVGRYKAERRVRDLGLEGTFLVRLSLHPDGQFPYILVVFHRGKVYNIGISGHWNARFALGKEFYSYLSFKSIDRLVRFHRETLWWIVGVDGTFKLTVSPPKS